MLLLGAEKWRMGVARRDVDSKGGSIKTGVVTARWPAAAAEKRTTHGVIATNRSEGVGCGA